MKRLKPGWYIILYHDISWEENCYIRSIGGTCPPDLFRKHVHALSSWGEILSVADGERRLRENRVNAPIFSFWFDDGLNGVYRYALPILEEVGVSGAFSICSRFVDRSEFFWRFKLAYLNSIDGMRFVRSHLKKFGFKFGDSVKTFTLNHFSAALCEEINDLFLRFTTPAQRRDAFRMFMDRSMVKNLHDRGWSVANHSGGHYPISQNHSLSLMNPEFEQCEEMIQEICEKPSDYWVIPFDYRSSKDVLSVANKSRGDRYIVFVRDTFNTPHICRAERVLYRICVPTGSPDRLIGRLLSL